MASRDILFIRYGRIWSDAALIRMTVNGTTMADAALLSARNGWAMAALPDLFWTWESAPEMGCVSSVLIGSATITAIPLPIVFGRRPLNNQEIHDKT